MTLQEAKEAVARRIAGQDVVVSVPNFAEAQALATRLFRWGVICYVQNEAEKWFPTDYATEAGFPSFKATFLRPEQGRVPAHLSLLGPPNDDEALVAIDIVRKAIESSEAPSTEIVDLFYDANWRPQLVGAVAVLLGMVNEDTLRALWEAFDSGSWVSPQLAVTAFRCDSDFEAKARRRIEAGCPISTNRLENLDWATRHSAAGPISFAAHSGKALASLVYLCRQLPTATGWLETALKDETIQQTLQKDMDNGGDITMHWQRGIDQALPEEL